MRFTGKNIAQAIGCALSCMIVLIAAFWNRTLVIEPLINFLRGEYSFAEMKNEVQENYLSDRFRGKFDLVTLNGGYARLTGRTSCNGIQRMTNGMITANVTDWMDTSEFVVALSRYHQYLQEQGIPLLLVMAPYKLPTEENLLPTGAADLTNEIADWTLQQLMERDVPVLDLREEMSQTEVQIEKYFYRTDHHWNVEGVFFGYQKIMDAIQEVFPETKMTFAEKSLWEKTVVPHFWLGSDGRRVGALFAGTDDLDYYLPAFETNMARYSLGTWTCRGDFREANMREWMLEQSDYFQMDTYSRYLGGAYAHTIHENAYAENRIRLGIIKDSFMRPVQCFLSTEFETIDAIDPRLFRLGTMNEVDYFTLNPPDMMIIEVFPQTLQSMYYASYQLPEGKGLKITEESAWESLLVTGSFGNSDYQALPAVLESGKNYVLIIESMQVDAGDPAGADIALYQGETLVDQMIFEPGHDNRAELRWGFRVPEDGPDGQTYQLRFYAGVDGATDGVKLRYEGIRLQECELIDP